VGLLIFSKILDLILNYCDFFEIIYFLGFTFLVFNFLEFF